MTHGIHRVTAFEIKSPHTLRVEFEDGLSRTIDFTPILEGELYGPLRDPGVVRGYICPSCGRILLYGKATA